MWSEAFGLPNFTAKRRDWKMEEKKMLKYIVRHFTFQFFLIAFAFDAVITVGFETQKSASGQKYNETQKRKLWRPKQFNKLKYTMICDQTKWDDNCTSKLINPKKRRNSDYKRCRLTSRQTCGRPHVFQQSTLNCFCIVSFSFFVLLK